MPQSKDPATYPPELTVLLQRATENPPLRLTFEAKSEAVRTRAQLNGLLAAHRAQSTARQLTEIMRDFEIILRDPATQRHPTTAHTGPTTLEIRHRQNSVVLDALRNMMPEDDLEAAIDNVIANTTPRATPAEPGTPIDTLDSLPNIFQPEDKHS